MEDAIIQLKKLNAKIVLVQFPEGLKLRIQDITKDLENAGFETVLSLERCWGACDIRMNEAKMSGCDAILHIGHGDFGVKSDIPVVYWDYPHNAEPVPALEKEIVKLKDYRNIGLVSSIQFTKAMEKAGAYLESRGKKVFIGNGEKNKGQILGCRVGAGKIVEGKVDCFLCISAGKFYPIGLAIKTDKPVFNLDLEKGQLIDMSSEKKRIMKTAAWNKSAFRDAKKVGLLVSSKPGQYKNPYRIKSLLEKSGKEVYTLVMDEFSPDKLEGLKLDVIVNTACPRFADDQAKYKTPIVNVEDILS